MPVGEGKSTAYSPYGLRIGRLSKGEMTYINENHREKTADEIAESLCRPVGTVVSWLEKNNLKVLRLDKPITKSHIEDKLLRSSLWATIKRNITKDEHEVFIKTWVNICEQFSEDLLPTEYSQLAKYITTGILMNRVLASQTQVYEQIDQLEKEIRKEKTKGRSASKDIIALNIEQISQLRSLASSYSKEHLDLSKEQNVILDKLKGSRSDRITNIKDSSKNWANIVALLSEDSIKKQVGQECVALMLAKEQAKQKLYQSHIYVDSKIDIPVLNHESIGELEESEDKNEGNTAN